MPQLPPHSNQTMTSCRSTPHHTIPIPIPYHAVPRCATPRRATAHHTNRTGDQSSYTWGTPSRQRSGRRSDRRMTTDGRSPPRPWYGKKCCHSCNVICAFDMSRPALTSHLLRMHAARRACPPVLCVLFVCCVLAVYQRSAHAHARIQSAGPSGVRVQGHAHSGTVRVCVVYVGV
jgi:hypothetical protein